MLKILLIDDNQDDRILIMREIGKDYPEVEFREVLDKKEFEDELGSINFNLVITDYQLKWSNGIKVLREIKSKDRFIPVIMFTATGNEEIAVEAMKEGLDDYVLKSPKHFKRLPASIKYVLEKVENKKKAEDIEKKYQKLFKNLPVGVFRTDYEGNIYEINPAFFEMFGFTGEELRNIKSQEIYADRKERRKFLKELEEKGVVKGYEIEFKRNDGKTFWGSVYARVIKNEISKKNYIEGTVIDITNEKILQQQLIQAQKMEAIGRLTGSIAHDFNNLLTPILGFTELLLLTPNLNEKQKRYINEIRKSTQSASFLVKKLLAFGRKQPVQFEIMNINTVLSEIDEILKRLIGEDISLTIETDPNLWSIKGDLTQIQQIIVNLVVNARDAIKENVEMKEGGKLIIKTENVIIDEEYCRVHSEARKGKFIILTVEDNGIGMDRETMKSLYKPFFTTKSIEKGTGLGLYVVRELVKQLGGWINVYSELGYGTTFKIYFPASIQKIEKKESVPGKILKEYRGAGERILIIEDDEKVREFLLDLLKSVNYEVFGASTGEEGLKIFEKEKFNFNAVICDEILPDIKGTELINKFYRKNPNLRILITSGYSDSEEILSKIKEMKCYFIQKPYTSIQQLLEKVSEVLS